MHRGVFAVTVFMLGLAGAAAGFLYGAIFHGLPEFDAGADLYALNRPAGVIFLDRYGNLAARHGAQVGERLKLSEMPDYLPAAFLAVEDRRFYQHGGIDPRAIGRAMAANYRAGDTVQGGSTITQQLARMLYLPPERSLKRKLREAGLALMLERNLSKDAILELYLNRIYLGSGAYGVDGAARVYFGKTARELTLAEAAMLAALPRAPSTFTPRRDLSTALTRTDLVLEAMLASGAAGAGAVAQARAHPAAIADRWEELQRGYFFDAAAEELRRLLPGFKSDLAVRTTFDPEMQEEARRALNEVLEQRGRAARASQGAIVAMSTDGALRAIVGGRDYMESQFNRATQARRQPGSSFKAFVYLAALEAGLKPWTVRSAAPVTIRGYTPQNYGGASYGPVTLQEALTRSINTVAIRVGNEIGVRRVAAAAHRMGIDSVLHPYPSLPLGTSEVSPLEMTAAFAGFASEGVKAEPYAVLEAKTLSGETVYSRGDYPRERATSEETARAMNWMLSEVVRSGTGRAADIAGREIAGKTGTSSEWRDAWFIGYSAELAAGVWVGNDDSAPMRQVTGGGIPAQIWNRFMRAALSGSEPMALARALPEEEPVPAMDDLALGPQLAFAIETERGERERREEERRWRPGVYFERGGALERDAGGDFWRGASLARDKAADRPITQITPRGIEAGELPPPRPRGRAEGRRAPSIVEGPFGPWFAMEPVGR